MDSFQVQFKVLHITGMNFKLPGIRILESPSIPKESALTAGAIEKLFFTSKAMPMPDGDSTGFFNAALQFDFALPWYFWDR